MSQVPQPPPPPTPPGYGPSQQPNPMAMTAMILGIAGVVLIWIPYISIVGLLAGIAGFVLGLIAIGKARQLGGAGRGQAITGIVTGAVTLGLFLITLIIGAAIIGGLS